MLYDSNLQQPIVRLYFFQQVHVSYPQQVIDLVNDTVPHAGIRLYNLCLDIIHDNISSCNNKNRY